ncbi:hypothetical protein LTR17_023655 [Elasticomyces elasticus]|nr:hypothetical protein LTR17_023655 [Elasticomyces elasticus]
MFKVERSVLGKHSHGKRVSIAKANEMKHLLTNKQELVLVNEIKRLCDWCLPPTPAMIFKREGDDHPEASGAESIPSRHSSGCLDTPSAQRTVRRIVNEAVAERDIETEKVIRKLGGACITLSAKLKLAEDRERGYLEAQNGEKKKRKRGQPFTEELRAEEGDGVLFFSPSKVQKARELQDAKEAAKEREALEKASRTEARAALKAQKELDAQQKRKGQAIRAEARKAEEALKKTQREQAREARKAQKQLETESKASQKRPRGRPPKQMEPLQPPVIVTEQIEEISQPANVKEWACY